MPGKLHAAFRRMEHLSLPFVIGIAAFLAVALMAVFWLPLFFSDFRAEKKRGHQPTASGENPPAPPLDKVHLN
jgi:hypothetical protein